MLHSNRALAQELIETVQAKFWDRNADFLLEMYPPKPGVETYSFLWGYGAYCTMLATYVKNARDMSLLPLLLKAAEKLELYRASDGEHLHYDSHPACFGTGEPYYDDNAWVALFFLDVYEITRDESALEKARGIADYLYSGWSDGIGGIRWKPADCNSSNTCSCGPTIVVHCKLYQITHEKKYLDRAQKVYEWTCRYLEDADGTFFDYINEKGFVDKHKYTYNTGTMIWSGVLLYEIMGDASYLDKACHSACGAMKAFVRRDRNGGKSLPPTPWFHVYLLQGLCALHAHVDMSEWLTLVETALRNASYGGRTAENLYYPEWSAVEYTSGKYYHQGLDDFGTAECFAQLIPFEERRRPSYCFLGSSVTYGCGDPAKSFVDTVAARQAFPCIKEAVCGTTLCDAGPDSYVARIKKVDPQRKIARLVVQLSTNDVWQNMPVGDVAASKNIDDFDCKTTVGAMEYIIAYAKKTWNCAITFFTNPPFDNAAYERLIDKLDALREKWGIDSVDFYRFGNMPALDGEKLASYMSDPVHPNPRGYEWMADVFCRYLQNAARSGSL